MGAFKRRQTARHDPVDPATLGDLANEGLHVFCWCHRWSLLSGYCEGDFNDIALPY